MKIYKLVFNSTMGLGYNNVQGYFLKETTAIKEMQDLEENCKGLNLGTFEIKEIEVRED